MVYLIKDVKVNVAFLDYDSFSVEEIEKAKQILDRDVTFRSGTDRRNYLKEKHYIQFGDSKKVQVDDYLIGDRTIDQVVDALKPRFFLDQNRKKYPISELELPCSD